MDPKLVCSLPRSIGCFYTSGLELKHKLQKMRLWECEIPNEVADVSAELQTGSEEFWGIEEARAIRGLDKDDHFYVDHTKWNCWSPERQRQHFNRFLCPNRTTRKGNRAQLVLRPHRNLIREGQNLSEPEIFADRIPDVNPPAEKISCTSPMPVKS